jgi:hypothetical protein
MGGRATHHLCADAWQVARPVRHQEGGIMSRARLRCGGVAAYRSVARRRRRARARARRAPRACNASQR